MEWKTIAAFCITVSLAAGISGCKQGAELKAKDSKADTETTDPVPVEIHTVQFGAIEEFLESTGNVYADSHVIVYPKASGQIVRVTVNEGDSVIRDQVLAMIDDDEHRLRVQQLEVTRRQAREKLDRTKQLHDNRMVSREAFDDANYRYEDADVAWKIAKLNMEYTRIKSPIDGIVVAKNLGVGDIVGVTSPVFEIIDPHSLMVDVFLPEREANRLRTDMPAKVLPDSLPGTVIDAGILRINPTVEAKTGTVKVTITFDAGASQLSSGMFVRVRIQVEKRASTVLLPKRALIRRKDENRVFVFNNDGVAELRFLTLGLENMHTYEVLSGLYPGENVIIVGQHSLENGQSVKLVESPVVTPLLEETDRTDL